MALLLALHQRGSHCCKCWLHSLNRGWPLRRHRGCVTDRQRLSERCAAGRQRRHEIDGSRLPGRSRQSCLGNAASWSGGTVSAVTNEVRNQDIRFLGENLICLCLCKAPSGNKQGLRPNAQSCHMLGTSCWLWLHSRSFSAPQLEVRAEVDSCESVAERQRRATALAPEP